ncbi:MAG TPA: DNA alkylation repair protein [Gammaproteobacteria bacterium]
MSGAKPAPPTLAAIRARVRPLADARIADASRRFFKTAPGDYGHGDRFLGIRVPTLRKLAREFRGAPLAVALALLRSPLHEERLLALLILVAGYARGTPAVQRRIYEQYLKHVPKHVNNWDLVDSSAPYIVGAHLAAGDRSVLYELARSPHLWSRRVAIIATFAFIKKGSFEDALAIAEQLLGDREDLIHKAAGWMLREIGNRDRGVAERFLRRHCRSMPRTMLRYAIEKLPERTRRAYLDGGDRLIFRRK